MPSLSATSDSAGSSPPSPVDDAASPRRLSWSRLVQKLTDFSAGGSGSSIDSSRSPHGSRSDLSDSGSDVSSNLDDEDLFYDPTEESLLREVVDVIARSLREAKDSERGALRCAKLLIPEKLLEHIGRELLHLAASEPCGLRGALIDLCVERDGGGGGGFAGGCEQSVVEQIAVDPGLVPTFQLTLVLRLESGGLWPKIQGLFGGGPSKSSSSSSGAPPAARQAIRLHTGFRVIKKKLYSSEELLIEEC